MGERHVREFYLNKVLHTHTHTHTRLAPRPPLAHPPRADVCTTGWSSPGAGTGGCPGEAAPTQRPGGLLTSDELFRAGFCFCSLPTARPGSQSRASRNPPRGHVWRRASCAAHALHTLRKCPRARGDRASGRRRRFHNHDMLSHTHVQFQTPLSKDSLELSAPLFEREINGIWVPGGRLVSCCFSYQLSGGGFHSEDVSGFLCRSIRMCANDI